jgi:hypothetical protein
VGFILAENDEVVTIAGHVGDSPDQCCGDVTIPRCAIREMCFIEYEALRKTAIPPRNGEVIK